MKLTSVKKCAQSIGEGHGIVCDTVANHAKISDVQIVARQRKSACGRAVMHDNRLCVGVDGDLSRSTNEWSMLGRRAASEL